MEYKATAKYVHQSTRKVRLVADSIRTLTPDRALALLALTPKNAAEPLSGVINSAVTNAKAKGVTSDKLVFKQIEIMGGPMMKRFHAVSKGMAHSYNKRMTHIRVILEDKK